MRLEWTRDLETGVGAIDDDHRLIIEFYNRIYHHYTIGADILVLERAIADFRLLFSLHCLREENFMIEVGYPDFESHAREHETMIRLLDTFIEDQVERAVSCQRIAFLVLQWLSSHLEGADRRLAGFAKQPVLVRESAIQRMGHKAHY